MVSERILLFGKNGQIGFESERALKNIGEVFALNRKDADFNEPETLRHIVRHFKPNIIVNAVAYTAVDRAEDDYKNAYTINSVAPRILAEEAEILGSVMVHYSTDYVYDGLKDERYIETDPPNPQSVYGKTKLQGDVSVMKNCSRNLIFRTSWIFGVHGNNFLKSILQAATKRHRLDVVVDQIGTPTSSMLISEVTADILKKSSHLQPEDDCWGLYHLSASGQTTWYDYARYIISQAGTLGYTLKASPVTIRPIMTKDYPSLANRPANSQLDTTKLHQTFGVELPEWKLGVDRVLGLLLNQRKQEDCFIT
jgi:dTDP-4-dehydrorhamnose reductase